MNLDFHTLEEPIIVPPRRRRRRSLVRILIRFSLLMAVVAGFVLAIGSWRAIGWPQLEVHKNDDGTFKEAGIVPTLEPWF